MQVMCVGFPFGFPSLLCCMLLLSGMITYVCYFTLTIDYLECEAEYYQSLEFNYQYQGKFTFDHSSNYLCLYYALSPFVVGLHGWIYCFQMAMPLPSSSFEVGLIYTYLSPSCKFIFASLNVDVVWEANMARHE